MRAIEEDDFDELGHRAFVRSHLSSYARFLGIDASEIVDELESMHDEPQPSAIGELDRQRRESRKPPRATWLIAAAVSVALLLAASVTGWLGGQAERPSADGQPAAAVVPVPDAHEPAPHVPPSEARVRLGVVALTETHVSVIVDGEAAFEGTLSAGQRRTFRARETLELLAADAGAISLSLNGTDLGTPGEAGVVFRGRYGPDGMLDG